jgi:replicative DNA helicase
MIPTAEEAEIALIGSLFHDENALLDVSNIVREIDFYDLQNRTLFRACSQCFDKHRKVDIIHVKQWLTDKGMLKSAGDVDYLVEAIESVPSSILAVELSHIIRNKSTERQLIITCQSIIQKVERGGLETSELLDKAHQEILSVTMQGDDTEIESLAETVLKLASALKTGEPLVKGFMSGFSELDDMIGGFRPGEVTIIAARPSVGKSMLALNIAENMQEQEVGVAIFSLEMEAEQLAIRSLARNSNIDSERLQRGGLESVEIDLIERCVEDMVGMNIRVDDRGGLTPEAVKRSMRRQMMQNDCKVCIVDYLQLLSATTGKSQYEKVSGLSMKMKEMAKELSIPMIVVAQLNRQPMNRDDARPKMSDLRDSGCIEQDADCILLLHRPNFNDPSSVTPEDKAELIIAKQRQGRTGMIYLGWCGSACKFIDPNASEVPF